jgi:DNA-binding transcriptional MerR regulator
MELGREPIAQAFTIGQLANATGVEAKTIRYYEQIGVLPTPRRTASGYRQYDRADVQRLRFIRRARSLGLSLRDVKALVVNLDGGPRRALRPRLLALVRQQLSAVEHQTTELQLLQQQLEQVLHRLLTSPRGQHREGCRCLEIDNPNGRPPSVRSRQRRTLLKATGDRASR